MLPPGARNFVPTERDAAKPKPPLFYTAGKTFAVAPTSMFYEPENTLTPLGSVPQPNHNRVSLPLRTVNSITRPVIRGHGKHFDRSTVAAKPPRGFPLKALGYHEDRQNIRAGVSSYDPKQKGLLVTSY